MSEVYVFGNGIRLRRGDVMDMQVERYSEPGNPNWHEPVEEEWMLRSFAEALPEAPLFLDIGAGVGYYSFLIKKRWPDAVVVAFEALARHADALEANRELNGLSPQDIVVVRAAVGPTSGEASFVDQGYGSMLAGGGTNRASVSVEMRSLTAVLQTLPPVHLMKMDIQGAELDVLKPASELLGRGGVRHIDHRDPWPLASPRRRQAAGQARLRDRPGRSFTAHAARRPGGGKLPHRTEGGPGVVDRIESRRHPPRSEAGISIGLHPVGEQHLIHLQGAADPGQRRRRGISGTPGFIVASSTARWARSKAKMAKPSGRPSLARK